MNNPPRSIRRGAVIDVGSNTIKVLVGEMTLEGLTILFDQTLECRISAGMYSSPPRFTSEAMEKATDAIGELIESARKFAPSTIEILATSAVRDAGNRQQFNERVRNKTGLPLSILSGEEEAEGIADGIAQEPGLDLIHPYTISDLGGGSLEWIFREGGEIAHLTSMELGAVRLMNRFVSDVNQPLSDREKDEISLHCQEIFSENLPKQILSTETIHWGTGGAFTISRLILATQNQIPLREQSPILPVSELQQIECELSALGLKERQSVPGLPASRADILPVALVIIQALAKHLGVLEFHHSFYNLRMGRLARMLSGG